MMKAGCADLECGEVSPLWMLWFFLAVARIEKNIQSGDTSPHSKFTPALSQSGK